ncbi:MAG: transglycosylase SLT domain-containing protein [Actinomycetota bacterium]
MRPTRPKLKRAGVVAAIAVMLVSIPAGAGAIPDLFQPDESGSAPGADYGLRQQVRRKPGADYSDRKTLRRAVHSLSEAACHYYDRILQSQNLDVTRVELILDRTRGGSHKRDAGSTACAATSDESSPWRVVARLRYPESSGRFVTKGPMPLSKALRKLGEISENRVDHVLRRDKRTRFVLRLKAMEKSVPDMIEALSHRYGVDTSTALRVAWCESHYDPEAYNPAGYGGVYQQSIRYWKHRAEHFGHPGADIFDAYSNIDVSLQMARDYGWSHWGCY